MAKLIRCKVTDEYVQGAGVVIGAAGSHNDVTIELAFSEIWEDTTKQVVWHNALGQNPTIILLTLDMRTEEGSYLVSVPFEAKEIEGDCSMTVKGAKTDGKVETFATLTTTAYFRVLPSAWDANAEESEDLTPSQAVLIQNQIDVLLEKIDKAVEAGDAADEAIAAKDAAVTAAGSAQASADAADKAAQKAADDARDAIADEMTGYVTAAQTAQRGAETSATAASAAQKAAEKARDEAQGIVGGDYATKEALEKGLAGKADLVDGKVPAEQLPDAEAGTADEIPVTDETAALLGLPEGDTVDDALALIAGKISGGGGAKIATGSYKGTGKSGSANPVTLTFDFEPKLLFVTSTYGVGFNANLDLDSESVEVYTDVHTLLWWDGLSGSVNGYSITINKNGNSISYYGYSTPYLNYSGTTYHYVAIG